MNGGASDVCHQQLMRYICKTYVTRFNYIPLEEDSFFGNGEWSPIHGLEINTEDDGSSTCSDL